MSTIDKTYRHIPLTLALCLGPSVAMTHSLLEDQVFGFLTIGQLVNGILLLVLFLCIPKRAFLDYGLLKSGAPIIAFCFYILLSSSLHSTLAIYDDRATDVLSADVGYFLRVLFVYLVFASAYLFYRDGIIDGTWLQRVGLFVLLNVVALQVVGKLVGFKNDPYESEFVFGGIASHVAITAAFLVSIAPTFLLTTSSVRFKKVAFILLLLAVLFTFRRSAILALILATLFGSFAALTILRQSHIAHFIALPLVILTLVSALLFFTAPGHDLIERLKDLNIVSGGTGAGRTLMWPIVIEHIADRNLIANIIGEGVNTINPVMLRQFGREMGAHNDWLDIIVSFGIPAVFLFFWFQIRILILSVTFKVARKPALLATAVMILLIFLVMSLTTGGVFEPAFAPAYATLGILLGMQDKINRSSY